MRGAPRELGKIEKPEPPRKAAPASSSGASTGTSAHMRAKDNEAT